MADRLPGAPTLTPSFGLKTICTLFGVSSQVIRQREKRGTLPVMDRNDAGERVVSLDQLIEWSRLGGMPGDRHGQVTPPVDPSAFKRFLETNGDPASLAGLPSLDTDVDLLPPERPAPARGPVNITDQVYNAAANQTVRLSDDVQSMRLERERLQLQRELEQMRNGGKGDTNALIAAVMQQNTEMMRTMMARPEKSPVELAIEIMAAVRGASQPVDLSERPEGRLYQAVSEKFIERIVGDMGDSADNGSGAVAEAVGGGLFGQVLELAKLVLPVLPGILARMPARPPVGTPVQVHPTASGETTSDPAGVPIAIAPAPPVLTLEDAPQTESIDMAFTDVFEAVLNLYNQGESAEDVAGFVVATIGESPAPAFRRLLSAPWFVLKLAIAAFLSPEDAAVLKTAECKAWLLALQAKLRELYFVGVTSDGKAGDDAAGQV